MFPDSIREDDEGSDVETGKSMFVIYNFRCTTYKAVPIVIPFQLRCQMLLRSSVGITMEIPSI